MGLVLIAGCPDSEPVIQRLPAPPVPRVGPQTQAPLTTPPQPTQPVSRRDLSKTKIIIDPGHGGKDPGAWAKTRSRMAEKAIVLDIGKQVAEQLRRRGATVIMTRSTDVFIELDDRAKAADRNAVDLFVSIHADSAERVSASGTEIHIYTSATGTSQQAAMTMVSALRKAGLECRGVQRSNLHVLREHSRPAMLIECGFLTNAGDATRLNTASYRTKLAAAIADGIAQHVTR